MRAISSNSAKANINKRFTILLAVIVMGLAHIVVFKQYTKGILFALCHVAFFVFLPTIVNNFAGLITLGEPQPDLHILLRDNSLFLLMDGMLTIAFVALFVGVYVISVRNALKLQAEFDNTGRMPTTKGFFAELATGSFPIVALLPTVLLILFFVVVPLIFAASVAFTNYSSPHNIPPNNVIDWVGLDNFRFMFGGNALWAGALGRVIIWTLAWAALATFTCYVGGFFMAVVMNNAKMRIAPFFRAILILPYAVPGVISLMVWSNMLNGAFGVVNRTLIQLGIISTGIPWLTDVWLARFMTVAINLWVGFPYFMLLVTGTMTAISQDIYEAAKIDGASTFQTTRRITLPLVLYQTTPLIIMSFNHNINNFGAIFFLTGGGPTMPDSVTTSAGGTDILVSWIFNLTVNLQQFHYASVLAVMIFVAIAPFAIFNFMQTKSFKEGDV
ncbi:MAG: sugar ABC transporter permease [Firmicutes bacterium]|nr:sugar ABC transporter permease [Bacillota bacterium]